MDRGVPPGGAPVADGPLFADGWAAVAIVAVTLFVARPVAVFVALAGRGPDLATKAFMAWFGPKGVATMTFSLLVRGAGLASGEQIFNIAALAVFCSIILHGLTDTPGAEWLARHVERKAGATGLAPAAPSQAGVQGS